MKHTPTPKTRNSGSRLTCTYRMYACGEDRPLREHEIVKSLALHHMGADPTMSSLAAEASSIHRAQTLGGNLLEA